MQVVAESKWQRSREWDNVLGYYDPQARQIVLHELVLKNKTTWQANFAVALGEALLGRYIARKWWEPDVPDAGARTYNIQLRAAGERECYLGSQPLRRYLELAQMMPQPGRKDCYFRLIAEAADFAQRRAFRADVCWMLANEFARLWILRCKPCSGRWALAAVSGANPRPAAGTGALFPRARLWSAVSGRRRKSGHRFLSCSRRKMG